ncbi:MAG: 16S rRNA (cytidine(1402)-2'-O)-methyltransferase [Candidatus Peribacteraceae bacterium]|jgi:16S rRNA (cytidine1402-2'-O)-methyltransferase|nr:16S rRNA (cytidine(1402)-2'-O)-methyltransferase [Candidatus Peribacteraceae bacterium]HCI03542.1 16S rRNA (cytidine(1402)-2'-O)-methyltransferase [Candidatus Peribacteria bacterium]|tara:strand:+ start:2871 stop:3542 length:672 start_codon:yes stop_codon:yes gene_type:complete
MLSIVSTPIGNLTDITLRAIATLTKANAIICEDTRVTGNLIKQLQIPKKELISMHSYTSDNKIHEVIKRLKKGEHMAVVSDAGTPAISDPGFKLISQARERGISIEVIPGPSAFLAALSVSGLPANRFVYLGFPPLKKGRKKFFASIADDDRTIVYYESVHRIEKSLNELAKVLNDQPDRKVSIARELTKIHEEVIDTTVSELPEVAERITKKGEFVVVVGAT